MAAEHEGKDLDKDSPQEVEEVITWTNEKVSELIDAFQAKPCLYNTKHKSYHNRDLRRKALRELSELTGFPANEVEKKLRGIRVQYVREKQKCRKRKTGDGLEDVYISKWIHFKQLEFLNDHITPKNNTLSNLQEIEQEDLSDENLSNDNTEGLDDESSTVQRSTKKPITKTPKFSVGGKRRREEPQEDILIKKAIECLEKPLELPQQSNPDDIFGQYVSSELKSIQDDEQKRCVKFKIQSLLYSAFVSPSYGQSQAPHHPPAFSPPYYGHHGQHYSIPRTANPWDAAIRESRSSTPSMSDINSCASSNHGNLSEDY